MTKAQLGHRGHYPVLERPPSKFSGMPARILRFSAEPKSLPAKPHGLPLNNFKDIILVLAVRPG